MSSTSVVQTDRITKVSLGQFDQAFILTQYLLNNGIDNLWCADANSDSPATANFTVTDPTYGTMSNVTLSSPRIILQPWKAVAGIGTIPVPVVFQMKIEQGTLDFNTSSNWSMIGYRTHYNMAGWKIAYSTVLSPWRVDPNSAQYQNMVAKLPPSTAGYGISSLFPGLKAPSDKAYYAHPDLGYSTFGSDTDYMVGSDTIMTALGSLVSQKLLDLFNRNLLVACYLTSSNNPSAINHPPTFVPTHNAQQGYPWTGPAPLSQPSFGLQGNSRMNYLCMLQMTNMKSPPMDESIPVNGNWTSTTPPTAATSTPLPRAGWTATADNPQVGYEASNVLDGNPSSIWHTQFTPPAPQYPHAITIDMKTSRLVSGLAYLPRQDTTLNGTIGKYLLEYSNDGNAFRPIISGYWKNDASLKEALFQPVLARYIRLDAYTESQGAGNPWASASEINVLSNGLPKSKWNVTTDSNEPGFDASKLLDGDINSFWHTPYSVAQPPKHPHSIQIEAQPRGAPIGLISGLSYVPRQDGSLNGNIGSFRVEASNGWNQWWTLATGTWADDATVKTVTFPPVNAPWVRLVALSEAGNRGPWTSAAEINVLDASGQVQNQSSSDFGTFIMSRENFFTNYLLPKLRVFNNSFEAYSQQPTMSVHMDGLTAKFSWNAPLLGIGTIDNQEPRFNFTSGPNLTWVFNSAYNFPSSGDYDEVEGNDAVTVFGKKISAVGDKIRSTVQCSTNNYVKFTPGTPRITVGGTTRVRVKVQITPDHPDPWKIDEITSTYNWQMYLDLSSVSDGGLAINVTKVSQPSDQTMELKYNDKVVGSANNLYMLKSYPDYLNSCITAAKTKFGALEAQLQQDLSGQQKFYFPASGTYFFKDPVFNNNGDLLCSVSYNGIDDAVPNPTAPDRKNIVPQTPLPIPQALTGINPSADKS